MVKNNNRNKQGKALSLSEAEQKIRLYETILNLLDVGIHAIDKTGRTIVYNTTMAKLECEDAANILGKDLLEALPYLRPENSTLLKVLKTGEALHDRKQTYINAHGKQIVTVNSTLPFDISGQLSGALEIAKNITYIQTL